MWACFSLPPHSWQYDIQKMAVWWGWGGQYHFCAWAKPWTVHVLGRVLRKGTNQKDWAQGGQGIQRDVKCSEKEVRGCQSKQGLFPDVASDQPCPLVYEADFKAINTEKSTHYLTFVSEIQHLVKRASDEGQAVNPQLEGEKCTWPRKKLGPTRCQVQSSLSCLPRVTACLL